MCKDDIKRLASEIIKGNCHMFKVGRLPGRCKFISELKEEIRKQLESKLMIDKGECNAK